MQSLLTVPTWKHSIWALCCLHMHSVGCMQIHNVRKFLNFYSPSFLHSQIGCMGTC